MTDLDTRTLFDPARPLPTGSASGAPGGRSFPTGFRFGVTGAATAIEGAISDDGRGTSIWDRFATVPGAVADHADTRRGAGHYDQMEDDVRLMAGIGAQSYSFSIAWPRVLPDGTGPINIAGLDFYDRLTDALLDAGIEPRPTLYHWDLPQPLEDVGGWTVRPTVDAFERFASIAVGRLADRIERWTTLHDPASVAINGHLTGLHAPGRRRLVDALAAAHHLLIAHGETVRTIRDIQPDATVGITLGFRPVAPIGDSPFAHRRQRVVDEWENHWFTDPIGGLGYPQFTVEQLGWDRQEVSIDDLETIATPIDFLGVIHRGRQTIGALDGEQPASASVERDRDGSALRFLLRRLYETYDIPTFDVIDSVAGRQDHRTADGRIIDGDRVDHFGQHLGAIRQAIDEGVPVGSYSVDLFDGFAWESGYSARCGLFEVDPVTLRRRPKVSAHWFSRLASGEPSDATTDDDDEPLAPDPPTGGRPEAFESRDHYLALLRRLDLPVDRALERIGIAPDADDAAELLRKPVTFYGFVAAIESLAGDPELALTIGREAARLAFEPQYMSFDPPLFGAYMSPTWSLLIQRIARYSASRSPIEVSVTVTESHVTVDYVWPAGDRPSATLPLAEFVYWIEIGRLGTETDFRPAEVFTPVAPADLDVHERFFGAPVIAGEHHRLVVDRAVADRPFVNVDLAMWKRATSALQSDLDRS